MKSLIRECPTLGSSAARAVWGYRGMRQEYRTKQVFTMLRSVYSTESSDSPLVLHQCDDAAMCGALHDAEPREVEKGTDRQP